MRLEDLGLIGNCQIAALVSRDADLVWACFPRLDSDPTFAALLDEREGGRFGVRPAGGEPGTHMAQGFYPGTLIIWVGDTVAWGWASALAPHTVTFNSGRPDLPDVVPGPGQGELLLGRPSRRRVHRPPARRWPSTGAPR